MSDLYDPSTPQATNPSQVRVPVGQLGTNNKAQFCYMMPADFAALAKPVSGALSADSSGNLTVLTLTFGDGTTLPISLAGLSSSAGSSSGSVPDGSVTDPQGSAITDPQGNVVTNN